jgi:hypothetical protein
MEKKEAFSYMPSRAFRRNITISRRCSEGTVQKLDIPLVKSTALLPSTSIFISNRGAEMLSACVWGRHAMSGAGKVLEKIEELRDKGRETTEDMSLVP